MILRYLIEKELRQLRRNSFLPRLILLFPCMVMLVMPWAATMEIEDLRVAVIDNDRSPSSERLARRIGASRYFKLSSLPPTYKKGIEAIERDETDLLLEIPRGFEKELVNGRAPDVLVAVNTVNGTKGALGSSYLTRILAGQPSDVSIRYRFNPHLDYKVFMIPALMAIVLVLLCGFLPTLNVVSEKERGTIEQINVTPVGRMTFTLAKLLPYWVMGFAVLTLCIAVARIVYGISPAGSVFTVYLAAAVFILVMSGLGLIISNHSSTLQQAMFVMWFFILVFILMSGLFTPVASMPRWAQAITYLNPLRYFVEAMRAVYLKGSTAADVWPCIGALAGFATVLGAWAVASYRKRE